jgi:hypothetical protein
MRAKHLLEGLGALLMAVAFLLISVVLGAVFLYGATWVSAKVLPGFSILTAVAFGIVVFVLLPLAIPKRTRGFASVALFVASYVFGATLWMESLLLTLAIWGAGAVFVGLFMAGVGVVPIAMIALIAKGLWAPLVEVVLLVIMTFASRNGALLLAESSNG